jgi:hypothetical protein
LLNFFLFVPSLWYWNKNITTQKKSTNLNKKKVCTGFV